MTNESRQITVVVGNPKPASRTASVAMQLAERITSETGSEPPTLLDLAELGAELLDWHSDAVAQVLEAVVESSVLVVASPTYKASYTGLLKLFLDRIGAGALDGVTTVPVMTGGSARHALAVDVHLRPVLVELGASCPTAALYVTEDQFDDPSQWLDPWWQRWGWRI